MARLKLSWLVIPLVMACSACVVHSYPTPTAQATGSVTSAPVTQASSEPYGATSPADMTSSDAVTTVPIMTSSTAGHPANVAPSIIRVTAEGGSVEVAALIAGLVEDGGTCTLVLKNRATGTTMQVTAAAIADAQSTVCGQLKIDSVASGSWDATVKYDSQQYHGVSPTTNVQVN